MRLGLVGLPMSGKTTIFNALTGSNRPTSVSAPGKLEVQLAVVDVPDPRLDGLYDIFQPERKVHAQVTYADVGGLAKGISEGGLSGSFRNQLNQMDALLHVIRAFGDETVPHPEGDIDPQRDLEILDNEFLLTDLITVENRIAKLQDEMSKGKNRDANQKELELFARLQAQLEAEQPLRDLEFKPAELFTIRGYGFLTLKSKLVVLNMGDEMPSNPAALVGGGGDSLNVIAIQGALEAEIAQLDPDEAAIFLEEYNIAEPVRHRVIRESYDLLNIQTFFTISEEEVRAWSCAIGATAQEAAGEIHTDLQRGFIRAEIVPSELLIDLGSMAAVREAGKLRLEGRDYIMQEGDTMTVRFKV